MIIQHSHHFSFYVPECLINPLHMKLLLSPTALCGYSLGTYLHFRLLQTFLLGLSIITNFPFSFSSFSTLHPVLVDLHFWFALFLLLTFSSCSVLLPPFKSKLFADNPSPCLLTLSIVLLIFLTLPLFLCHFALIHENHT